MSSAKITLIGFNNYMQSVGTDLFKDLSLPEGIDKENLVDNILLTGGEFESLYSDPFFLQGAIGVWAKKWYRTFSKWQEALNIEYNPLENYDRFEDWTDDGEQTSKSTSKSDSKGNDTSSGSTTNSRSAYDAEGFSDHDKSESKTESDTSTETNAEADGEQKNKSHHIGRLHGNIGVTTSQQMLQSELDIAEWNLIQHITDIFLSEFVIPIY